MARCVEDYTGYGRFPFNLFCFPRQLLLRGHRLSVEKAPQPEKIVWENIEVSVWTRVWSRTRTNLITVILLIVGFVIVLQANLYLQYFESQKPDLSLCSAEIPALYVGSYTLNSRTNNMVFARPDQSTAEKFDTVCKVIKE